MFCPQCRTEYVEGILVCADCGAQLVQEIEPKPAPEYFEFEEILCPFTASDIAMIKSLLQEEGIDHYVEGEISHPITNPYPRIMVRKDRAQEARELLKDFIDSPSGSSNDAEPDKEA